MIYLLVGIAGSLGATLRYTLGLLLFHEASFPLSTLCINLIGCFLLAYFSVGMFARSKMSVSVKTAIGTGFIGSFTTFSTVSVETVTMLTEGDIVLGCIYIFFSLVGGLLMSSFGFYLQKARKPV